MATSIERGSSQAQPTDLRRFQQAVQEGIAKDRPAFEANQALNAFNSQRDNHWKLEPEGEQGIKGVISQFENDNGKIMAGLAESYTSDMQAKSDLYEAIILKGQSLLHDETLKTIENNLNKAAKEQNYQDQTKNLENLALLIQIWGNQVKALEMKSELSEAEKWKKVKVQRSIDEARRIITEKSPA